jgi:hypothetical protein
MGTYEKVTWRLIAPIVMSYVRIKAYFTGEDVVLTEALRGRDLPFAPNSISIE